MATYHFDPTQDFELQATRLPHFSPLKDAFIAYFVTWTNMNWNTLTTLFNHEFQTSYPDWTPLYGTLFYRWIWMKRAMKTDPAKTLPSDMASWISNHSAERDGNENHPEGQHSGKLVSYNVSERRLRDTESWEWMRETYFDRFWKNEGVISRPYEFMKRPELTNEELILGQKVRNKGWEIRKYLGIGGFDGTVDVGDDDDDDTEEGEEDHLDIDSLLPWSIFKTP